MPLPRLTVLREDYCSQEVVDLAVASLETHRPELTHGQRAKARMHAAASHSALWRAAVRCVIFASGFHFEHRAATGTRGASATVVGRAVKHVVDAED